MSVRLSRAQRESRDTLIYRLHLAGVSLRDIARRVDISKQAVHKIVRAKLADAATVQDDLATEAEAEHLDRLTTLLSAQWPKAVAGDTRASEFCRRLMVDIARVKGLNTSVAERLTPLRGGRDADDDFDIDAPDDLEAYRLKRDGIAVADGCYVDTGGRRRSPEQLERDADQALNS